MTILAQAAVSREITLAEWFGDGTSWTGPAGIFPSLAETLVLCSAVIVTSIALAVPVGAVLAHKGIGEMGAAWVLSLGRALPTFALAALLVPISLNGGFGFEPWPIFIALTFMTVPPMFLSTHVAVRQVEPSVIQSARAMGLSERRILLGLELPLAQGVLLSGLRIAAVQVVATEPIRAYLGGNGLGRYIRDGIGQNNPTLTIAGTILITSLAGITALAFVIAERWITPYGVARLRQGHLHATGAVPNEVPPQARPLLTRIAGASLERMQRFPDGRGE